MRKVRNIVSAVRGSIDTDDEAEERRGLARGADEGFSEIAPHCTGRSPIGQRVITATITF